MATPPRRNGPGTRRSTRRPDQHAAGGRGPRFGATPRPDLAEPYAAKYYDVVDWVWKNKSFHMAEALLEGLYPYYADPATLVELGHRWLADHEDADNALKRIVRGNVESSQRTLKVRELQRRAVRRRDRPIRNARVTCASRLPFARRRLRCMSMYRRCGRVVVLPYRVLP